MNATSLLMKLSFLCSTFLFIYFGRFSYFSGVVVHLNCFVYNSACMSFNNRNSTCIHKVSWYGTVILVPGEGMWMAH